MKNLRIEIQFLQTLAFFSSTETHLEVINWNSWNSNDKLKKLPSDGEEKKVVHLWWQVYHIPNVFIIEQMDIMDWNIAN